MENKEPTSSEKNKKRLEIQVEESMKHMPVLQLQEDEENFQVPVIAKSETQSSKGGGKSGSGKKERTSIMEQS